MNKEELKQRTKTFAIKIIAAVEALPKKPAARVLGDQLLRAATSVAANYRASCRARSYAEFISKLGTVEEEADESMFWLELIVESKIEPEMKMGALMQEANELTAIFTAAMRTSKRNRPVRADLLSQIRNPKSEIPNPQT